MDDGKLGWFVAQLRPNGLAQAQRHLDRQGFETFSPELYGNEIRQGRQKTIPKPVFPGYLFIRFDPLVAGWTAINYTRGVSRLIINNGVRPVSLPDEFMAGLRARYSSNGLAPPPQAFEVGDKIRVVAGPFADLVTQIETVSDGERVGLLLDLMGRQVRASLPRSHILKVS